MTINFGAALGRYFLCAIAWLMVGVAGYGQDKSTEQFDYFLTGEPADVQVRGRGGIVLMGGSTDVVDAFRWMIERAGGGDFVVIRASGSDGYNDYLIKRFKKLDSVESIVFKNREAAFDPFIVDRLRQADAIFVAGGNQSNYVEYWKETPVEDAIHERVAAGVPIGGTSAGLAILGEYSFSASSGSATSERSLADPYDSRVQLENEFLHLPWLNSLITDSHFSQRGRMGRLVGFLARMSQDHSVELARGIGVDEKTAVLVEPNGWATVVGKNHAWFVRAEAPPELCCAGQPLTFTQLSCQRLGKDAKFYLPAWGSHGGETYGMAVRRGVVSPVVVSNPANSNPPFVPTPTEMMFQGKNTRD